MLSATMPVEPSPALTCLDDDLQIHQRAWDRAGGVAEVMQRTMGTVRTQKYGSKRRKKSAGVIKWTGAREAHYGAATGPLRGSGTKAGVAEKVEMPSRRPHIARSPPRSFSASSTRCAVAPPILRKIHKATLFLGDGMTHPWSRTARTASNRKSTLYRKSTTLQIYDVNLNSTAARSVAR